MKWSRSELVNAPGRSVVFDEEVRIDAKAFAGNSRINGVKDVRVSGRGNLDLENDSFYVTLAVKGTMLVPDAVTGREIDYDFETDSEEIYTFAESEDEEVRTAENDVIDLLPAVIDMILLEVPLQVTHAVPEEYPSGDGWRIITEEEYQKSQEDRIDQRLAKFKDYIEET